ncbi:hypothetical protein GP486_001432, partial [Trichoglossum hirsutum]
MSTSPRQFPSLRSVESYSALAPPSPRISRTIRRLQSAHTLSSNPPPSDAPPVPPLQRWLPQNRTVSSARKEPPPPIPAPSHVNPTTAVQVATRSRSNSDAPVASVSTAGPSSKRNAIAKRVVAPGLIRKATTLEAMLREGPPVGDIMGGLRDLRFLVLTDGVVSDSDGMSSLRIYIWLILLSAPPLETDAYLALVHRGPSPAYSKIRNDTFRTLATDPLFRRRVSEASLIRLLNAVAWKLHDAKEERNSVSGSPSQPGIRATNTATADGSPELRQSVSPVVKGRLGRGPSTVTTEGSEAGGTEPGTYVQGMNVLAAPFLYAARSEAEAFVAFHRFLTRECPGYVRGAMDGVHRGLSLVDKCLALCDPKLSAYLLSKGMHAELYAFPSVLTLCACTPPLPEVLHLWDFLFAYGAHLNVLCIVAQLCMARESILKSQ